MIPAKEIGGELWVRAADARIKSAAKLRLEMDLRDYFAAKALHGLISCPDSYGHRDEFAKYSYEYADAMLEARMK